MISSHTIYISANFSESSIFKKCAYDTHFSDEFPDFSETTASSLSFGKVWSNKFLDTSLNHFKIQLVNQSSRSSHSFNSSHSSPSTQNPYFSVCLPVSENYFDSYFYEYIYLVSSARPHNHPYRYFVLKTRCYFFSFPCRRPIHRAEFLDTVAWYIERVTVNSREGLLQVYPRTTVVLLTGSS